MDILIRIDDPRIVKQVEKSDPTTWEFSADFTQLPFSIVTIGGEPYANFVDQQIRAEIAKLEAQIVELRKQLA